MMYIVYCVETHGECVENGVGSVELFHTPRHSFHTLHTYFPTILIGIIFLIPLFINHLSYII